MNRLQNIADHKRRVAASGAFDEKQQAVVLDIIDAISKELDYTQQNVPQSTAQKGEQFVRNPGVVTVRLKYPAENADYKIDTTLLTTDPDTGALSLANSVPLYNRRRRDSFDVECSVAGRLKWRIEAF